MMRRFLPLAVALVACSSSPAPDGAAALQKVPPPAERAAPEVPPRIDDLAFFHGSAGPRVLARGVGTVGELHVELLDAAGAPADLGEDPSTIDLDGPDGASPSFFVEIQAASTLGEKVAKVAVTPRDRSGNPGARRVAPLSDPPVRELDEACDPAGFDRCADGTTCAPGEAAAANACARTEELRASRCAAAPVLVAAGGASVTGTARGASLWDPMEGCASSERRGRPEGLVWLRVPAGAASITLSTTASFDTVLSVHRACDTEPELACNDDAPGPGSSLSLAALEPGDYLVVVDALVREGGTFELRVTTP